jgi:hypothetical protein
MDAFLHEIKDPKNVIVIHCKAGKGRTGLMTTSYLLFKGCCKTAIEAIQFYGNRRTTNGEGLTIASQIRYLGYFEKLLSKLPIKDYPIALMNFLDNPEDVIEKYIPTARRPVTFINIGPFTNKVKKITFQVINFDYLEILSLKIF